MDKKLVVDLRLVRKEGWVLPRFRSCMYRPVRGVLVLREEHQPDLMRTMRTARLLPEAGGPALADVLPLYDATLVWCDGTRMVLTGFERVQAFPGAQVIDYAQSWDCELVGEEKSPG